MYTIHMHVIKSYYIKISLYLFCILTKRISISVNSELISLSFLFSDTERNAISIRMTLLFIGTTVKVPHKWYNVIQLYASEGEHTIAFSAVHCYK